MPHAGQRRYKRYEVHDVHGALLFRTQVLVRNLSVAGLALESAERLQMGRPYAIRLVGAKVTCDVTGTIRWCRLSSARPVPGSEPRAVYVAGLAFEDVFTEKARGLLGFLEHHVVLAAAATGQQGRSLVGRVNRHAVVGVKPGDREGRGHGVVLSWGPAH